MDIIRYIWNFEAVRVAAMVLLMGVMNVVMGIAISLTRDGKTFDASAFAGGLIRAIVAALTLAVLYLAGHVCPDIVVIGVGEEALTVPLILNLVMAGAFGFYFMKDLKQACRLVKIPIPRRIKDLIDKHNAKKEVTQHE